MKKFLKKSPQIFLKTITGQELSQGQKEAMRDVRSFINDVPAPSQQELEVQRQATQQAEAARAQAQADQQAAEQRAATAKAEQEAANAKTAKLQAEAAQLQAQLDAANARTSAVQEARKVADLKAQLAQLNMTSEGAVVGESVASIEKKEAPAGSESSAAAAGAATPPPSPNAQQDSDTPRALDLKEKLAELAQDIFKMNVSQKPEGIEQVKDQVRAKVAEYKLSSKDFELLETLVVRSFEVGVTIPYAIDTFLNELEGMTVASDNVPLAGVTDLDLTS